MRRLSILLLILVLLGLGGAALWFVVLPQWVTIQPVKSSPN
jgi:hypothetical protein